MALRSCPACRVPAASTGALFPAELTKQLCDSLALPQLAVQKLFCGCCFQSGAFSAILEARIPEGSQTFPWMAGLSQSCLQEAHVPMKHLLVPLGTGV